VKAYEYHEGIKAREHFETGMKALFQVPKDAVSAKKKARKKRAKRSTSRRAASRDSEADAQTS
jgi:hypothetical protein